jgi:hypothetical protein
MIQTHVVKISQFIHQQAHHATQFNQPNGRFSGVQDTALTPSFSGNNINILEILKSHHAIKFQINLFKNFSSFQDFTYKSIDQ